MFNKPNKFYEDGPDGPFYMVNCQIRHRHGEWEKSLAYYYTNTGLWQFSGDVEKNYQLNFHPDDLPGALFTPEALLNEIGLRVDFHGQWIATAKVSLTLIDTEKCLLRAFDGYVICCNDLPEESVEDAFVFWRHGFYLPEESAEDAFIFWRYGFWE